jgi:hypothetical protein
MEKKIIQQKKVKKPKLTKKRKGFVKDLVITGDRKQAVMNNFDTINPRTAHSIATELMQKSEIIEAVIEAEETFKQIIDKHLPEETVVKKHLELMNATRMDHMVFPLGPEGEDDINLSGAIVTRKQEDIEDMGENELPEEYKERTTLTDIEIIEMLKEVNCVVRRIVHGNTARHVYFWAADNMARDKALDKAYKIRGRYGDEANLVRTPQMVTYNFLFAKDTQERIAIINKEIKAKLIDSNA